MFENIEKAFMRLNPLARTKAQTDHITIRGTVIITNGKTHIVAQNRIVSQGIRMLLTWLGGVYGGGCYQASINYQTVTTYARMRIGTDTTHVTTEDMTSLSNEVTTDRNSANVTISKLAAGQYRVAWVATWNAGTVSGVCGEIGLSLAGMTPLTDGAMPQTNYGPTGLPAGPFLFSRLSSASGDFTSFTINNAVPLVIEWRLEITF
jgi:hypothetical protein